MADELLQEFLTESWENLTRLDTEIVELEKEPGNRDLIASIFRTIHTIKGTCGFIGLDRLGAVAHSAENVLGRMRDGALDVTADSVSLVLEAVDRIKELLEDIEATGSEPETDNSKLIHKLDLLASLPDAFPGGGGSAPAPAAEPAPVPVTADEVPAETEPTPEAAAEPTDAAPVAEDAALEATAPEATAPETPAAAPEPESAPAEQREEVETAVSERKGVADLSIRVNVDVLDSLMNLVGELVLTRNQLLQTVRGEEESRYATPIAHLNRVTTDLQEGVMKTRMQPIGNAWNKLPRLIRDLSRITNKHIELEMSGAETELDRTVLDAIKDPLTHMVRNSADHGLESPADRAAAGKSETGYVRLNAWHEGGHVIICVEDDGQGIDVDRVTAKAIEKGLISEADAAGMSHNEALQLVFHPGFSTAEKISSVSGRGVGMDVVRTQIEKIGGTVDLTSVRGEGTSIRIKLPLTLAIISAVVVESGGESFAIPQLGIVELVRLSDEDRERIEHVHDRPVFRLRDRLLPLVYLDEVLGLNDGDEREQDDVNIVVVQVGEDQFGVVVTEVFDTEEIVVKPVGMLLKDLGIYQGTTILGDGRVIMILDVAGVAARSGGATPSRSDAGHDSNEMTTEDTTRLLVFDPGNGSHMAVPLALVARLEEIPASSVEWAGDMRVVQYRGDLLPLLPVEGMGFNDTSDVLTVIVFTEGVNSMGLVVHAIHDILEEKLVIRMQSQRRGVAGTAVVSGRSTDVIDTQWYVTRANPEWFRTTTERSGGSVLMIDPSRFLRELAATALTVGGVELVSAAGLDEGIERAHSNATFDLVLLDLDELTGRDAERVAELAQRTDGTRTPVVGLASRRSPSIDHLARAFAVEQVLEKFDPSEVLRIVEQHVAAAAVANLEQELAST